MVPITGLTLSKLEEGKLRLIFQYPNRTQGFDHALVAIIEQDSAQDIWSVRPRTVYASGSTPNVLTTTGYSFYNESYSKWLVTPFNSSGNQDDVGYRHYLINLNLHSSGDNVTLTFPYGPQPDLGGGGLEFYALVAVAAKAADNKAVAILGDMAISNLITGV